MTLSASPPHAAYCEEYNEDAHTTVPDTRQSANVAAKRSKPDVGKLRIPETSRDEFSDSGYSSRTGATLGSGDSSLASKIDAAPAEAGTSGAENAKKKDVPQNYTQKAAEGVRKPALRRTESKARDGPKYQKEINSHGQATTVYPAAKSSERRGSSTRATVNQAAPEAHPKPATTKPLPPTPTQYVPMPPPAQVRPRASSTQPYRAGRPMSFHAGMAPQISYTPQISYAPQLYIPAPAYSSPATHLPSQTAQQSAYYAQQSPVQPQSYSFPPSPYEPQPRPPSAQLASEQPRPYRHSAIYNLPQGISYSQRPTFPIATAHTESYMRNQAAPMAQSSPTRERRYSRDEDYYRMPPPPPPPPKRTPIEPQQTQRPTIRHAVTTSATMQRRSGRTKEYRDDRRGPPSPQKEKPSARETSRRPPVTKRPSAASSNNSASSSHAIERDMARLNVSSEEASKQRRRMSYHGHESHRDLERSVEAYQASTGVEELPVTADSLNLIRKKTAGSNTSSRVSGSGRGSREGSDVKPRSSTDRRGGSDVKPRKDDDGLTMRFNSAYGVNFDLKEGSVEGRKISLRQSRDGGEGDMEFSIGSKSNEINTKPEVKEKRRKRYSFFGSSSIREVEPASRSASRPSRDVKADEDSKSRSRKIAGSRSRRSSRSGRG